MNSLSEILNDIKIILIPLLISFGAATVISPVMIPWLHKLKFGQQILEDGPVWHKKKQGTPTMGGIMFILGIAAASLVAMLVRFDIHYPLFCDCLEYFIHLFEKKKLLLYVVLLISLLS